MRAGANGIGYNLARLMLWVGLPQIGHELLLLLLHVIHPREMNPFAFWPCLLPALAGKLILVRFHILLPIPMILMCPTFRVNSVHWNHVTTPRRPNQSTKELLDTGFLMRTSSSLKCWATAPNASIVACLTSAFGSEPSVTSAGITCCVADFNSTFPTCGTHISEAWAYDT